MNDEKVKECAHFLNYKALHMDKARNIYLEVGSTDCSEIYSLAYMHRSAS